MTSTTPEQEGPQKLLSVLHLDSIRNKILVLALLATLIPAVGTAVIAYEQSRRALTENLNGELVSRASQAAREVDLWMKERAYDVRVFTGSFEVSENLQRIQAGGAEARAARARLTEYLNGVFGRFTDYTQLLVTDPELEPLASTAGTPGSVELDDEWLVRLRRGETVLGEPYADGTTSRISATLAAPIETTDGRFIGVLAAALALEAIEDVLAGLAPGETGRIDLVTEDGSLVMSTDAEPDSALGQALPAGVLEELAAAPGRDQDTSVEYTDRGGDRVVGALMPVPGLSWAAVAQIPTSEAFAQVAQLRTSAFFLVSFLLIVVGSVAYLLGLVIVRPLARLTDAAGAVAEGDLSVDLPAAGRGEVGYLTDVFNEMVSRLRASREELDERNRELERLSTTDLLTGLNNRRFLLDAFDKEIKRADRHERPFCVLMIDVDRFKQYNDAHGHPAGDHVLSTMGSVIKDAIRDLDVAARYGGEEFIVLLPECDVENAGKAAERIRTRLAREQFEGGPVTISVGIAEFPSHGDSAARVIGEADAALYEAKAKGRDRVQCAEPRPEEETEERKGERTRAARHKRQAASKREAPAEKGDASRGEPASTKG